MSCAQICPKDYVPTLLKYVTAENLPEYLGGQSKATLLDDAGPWNNPELIAEVDAEVKAVCSHPHAYPFKVEHTLSGENVLQIFKPHHRLYLCPRV